MWRQLTKTISACPAPRAHVHAAPKLFPVGGGCWEHPLFRPLGTTALGSLVWDSASGKHFNFLCHVGDSFALSSLAPLLFPFCFLFRLSSLLLSLLFFSLGVFSFQLVLLCSCCCFGHKELAVLTNTRDEHTYVIMRVAAETLSRKSGRKSGRQGLVFGFS